MQLRAWRTVTFPDCSFRAVGTSLSDPRQTSSTPLQPPQGTVGDAGGCKLDAEAGGGGGELVSFPLGLPAQTLRFPLRLRKSETQRAGPSRATLCCPSCVRVPNLAVPGGDPPTCASRRRGRE